MIAVCFNIKGYEKHMTFGKQYHVILMTARQGYQVGSTFLLMDNRNKMISFEDNFWDYFMRVEDWRDKQIEKLV